MLALDHHDMVSSKNMVVRRGRPLKGFGGDSSSDSDDDASMSKKKKSRLDTTTKDDNKNTSSTTTTTTVTTTETSSNKRHHHINAARQAKMDSLLQELQTTKPSDQSSMRDDYYGTVENDEFYPGSSNRFAPDKKGSYVEPGMEHLTSNLFVGNLDPMTTEEELTDCFRQYGDLYSVKIMWPRTAEERARNRNTGFVCFMHRKDAEDAMDSLADADPLGTGRRLNIGWGKNVKKTVKRGTGGVPLNFRKRPKENQEPKKPTSASLSVETSISQKEVNHHPPSQSFPESTEQIKSSHHPESAASSNIHPSNSAIPKIKQQSQQPIYDPVQHSADAIIVKAPSDARRMQFISTVASFVAKDGSIMEQKLIETQSFNSDFRFLKLCEEDTTSSGTSIEDNERFEEHIFYRWRVYAFAQGDGFNSWRTQPFVMFQPHGRYWIPPPLNTQAAQKEEESEKRREKHRLAAQEERRKHGADNKSQDCIKTGAQLRRSTDIVRLNEWEREVFHELLREKLCASQESICEAMAFCFDKSGAAREIAGLLKEALLETGNEISLETRIARLFLMSDILFNSQQPGVRNAFQYRTAIEAMSPEVFECLGKYECGRMTKNKLRKAVSSVLSAWTYWSVFDSDFIDELERKFEGREILVTGKVNNEEEQTLNDREEETRPDSDNKEGLVPTDDKEAPVSTTPRGTWTSATNDNVDADVDGEAIDEDIDGEAIDDLDGEEIDGEAFDEDIDGEEVDIDGLPDTETR